MHTKFRPHPFLSCQQKVVPPALINTLDSIAGGLPRSTYMQNNDIMTVHACNNAIHHEIVFAVNFVNLQNELQYEHS